MKCPICNIHMVVLEHRKIEVDYCVKCLGVWFDSGELELLLETMKAGGDNLSLGSPSPREAKSGEKKRRCPICGQKMKKALVGEKPGVLVDTCPREEGLWFDSGEVEQAIEQMTQRPLGKLGSQGIVSFLGDVFKAGEKPSLKR